MVGPKVRQVASEQAPGFTGGDRAAVELQPRGGAGHEVDRTGTGGDGEGQERQSGGHGEMKKGRR